MPFFPRAHRKTYPFVFPFCALSRTAGSTLHSAGAPVLTPGVCPAAYSLASYSVGYSSSYFLSAVWKTPLPIVSLPRT